MSAIDNPSGELFSGAAEAKDIAETAKGNLDFLSALAMPTVFEFGWPRILTAVWMWLLQEIHKQREFPNMALGLPRGFGKTTLVKLFILYCILFTDRRFVLVLSATEKHAINIIRDVCSMLDEPNIRNVFGNWRDGLIQDTMALKVFGFRGRTIILAGIGAGGSVRGINVDNARPDVMIFEDVQTREDADSKQVSDDLDDWMVGTAMKAKSPKGCMTLFIANMYPTEHSLLKKLKRNPHWAKFICGGILEDGTSLWEDLQPIKQLFAEFLRDVAAGKEHIFAAEVLNDEEAGLNNLIDFSKLKDYPHEDGDIHQGNFIIIDPSNDKANSDSITTSYFEVQDGRPVVREIDEGRYTPLQAIEISLEMAMRNNCSLVVIEANAYQYSLKYWSEYICDKLGIIGITFLPIYSGKISKNARILTMFKAYVAGDIWIHSSCQAKVKAQIQAFNPLKTNNIDGILDCLTYAPRVIEEMADYIKINTIEGRQEFEGQEIEYLAHQNSPF
ncbi:hypothetical protein [Edaphovirga cremea]|uniref:hypothetical protein n=1 Tax=Edaphovirga cremea TaxID=2267246 RepID=UPI00398907B7